MPRREDMWDSESAHQSGVAPSVVNGTVTVPCVTSVEQMNLTSDHDVTIDSYRSRIHRDEVYLISGRTGRPAARVARTANSALARLPQSEWMSRDRSTRNWRRKSGRHSGS